MLKSYLKNRSHVVKKGSRMSKLKTILCQVPQGSVLGPLLFILMINNLPAITSSSVNSYLYADDTEVN